MDAQQHIWQSWAAKLHRWGLQEITASLLEAGGPLSFLAAQFVYLGQPLLNTTIRPGHLDALASMLEDPQETRSFIKFLREDAQK